MERTTIFYRPKPLIIKPCDSTILCGIIRRFQRLSPSKRQVLYALLTRAPLVSIRRPVTVRLACIKPAASVHPEPGSNSPYYVLFVVVDELTTSSSRSLLLTSVFFALRLLNFVSKILT